MLATQVSSASVPTAPVTFAHAHSLTRVKHLDFLSPAHVPHCAHVRAKATSGSDRITAVVVYGSKIEAEGAARNATGQELRGCIMRAEVVSGADGAGAGTTLSPPIITCG